MLSLLLASTAFGDPADTDARRDALTSHMRELLDPLLGEDNYRLQLALEASGEGQPPVLEKLILVLNSEASAASALEDKALRELLFRSADLPVKAERVYITRLPFHAHVPYLPEAPKFSTSEWLLVLAALLILLLCWRLWNRTQMSAGLRLPWQRAKDSEADDFHGDLLVLQQMACDDPARVAQVIKQWVNAGE